MEYNIQLFVHGVPDGQRIWGPQDGDRRVIQNFYGRRSSVQKQLYVEVSDASGAPCAYYTYLRTGDVQEMAGRQGSYVGLTLRMNLYYRDLANLYNVLDAAFSKYLIGTAVKPTQTGVQYLVNDFNLIDNTLIALQKELVHYLMQFSTNADFMPLDGFCTIGQEEAAHINVLECNDEVLAMHVSKHGNLAVSPLFPSHDMAVALQQKDAEIMQMRDRATAEINALQEQLAQERDQWQQQQARMKANINQLTSQLQTAQSELAKYKKAVPAQAKTPQPSATPKTAAQGGMISRIFQAIKKF